MTMKWWDQKEHGAFGDLSQGNEDSSRGSLNTSSMKGVGSRRFGEASGVQDLGPIRGRGPASGDVDIPEISQKEKKKRGGGFFWRFGAKSSEELIVAPRIGATSARSWGFLGTSRLASSLSQTLGPATWLGGLFASSVGPAVALGAMMTVGLAMGVAAFGLYGRFMMGGQGFTGPRTLGGVDSAGIKVRGPRNRSLDYLTKANQGEIKFEEHQVPAQTNENSAETKPAESVPETTPPANPESNQLKIGLEAMRDQFIKKLTKDTGELQGGKLGAFGTNTQLARNSNFSTVGGSASSFNAMQGSTGSKFGRSGKLSTFSRRTGTYTSSRMGRTSARSTRAIGQLKFAQNMSGQGARTTADEGQKGYSTDAFDQGRTSGGSLAGPGIGSGVAPIIGGGGGTGGAGAGTGSNPNLTTPGVGPGTNVTPYQSLLNAAQGMGGSSAGMKLVSLALMAAGIALILKGTILKSNHTTLPIGIALMAAGIAMVGMGGMMLKMSINMANMGSNLGQAVSNQYGQSDQGQIIDDCMKQASANGTRPENCKPSTQPQIQRGTVQQDVNTERNSTYSIPEGAGSQ